MSGSCRGMGRRCCERCGARGDGASAGDSRLVYRRCMRGSFEHEGGSVGPRDRELLATISWIFGIQCHDMTSSDRMVVR